MTAARLTRALRHPGRQPALVPYLTAGYPSPDAFAALLVQVARLADVVEIGVPFTDPMADGVTIQRTSRQALEAGVTLRGLLAQLRGLELDAPVVLMSYLNPLLAYGPELVADARAADVSGFIVPDLPLDESADLRALCAQHGLALVQLVTPVTPPDRLARLCAASAGFVYAVTMTGITGGAVPDTVGRYLDAVRAHTSLPVCAGFGIRTSAHVRALSPHVDGVVVGSALLEHIAAGGDPLAFLQGLCLQSAVRSV